MRICAERLRSRPGFGYLPAYEIVTTVGVDAFEEDRAHVRQATIARIVDHMLAAYSPEAARMAVVAPAAAPGVA